MERIKGDGQQPGKVYEIGENGNEESLNIKVYIEDAENNINFLNNDISKSIKNNLDSVSADDNNERSLKKKRRSSKRRKGSTHSNISDTPNNNNNTNSNYSNSIYNDNNNSTNNVDENNKPNTNETDSGNMNEHINNSTIQKNDNEKQQQLQQQLQQNNNDALENIQGVNNDNIETGNKFESINNFRTVENFEDVMNNEIVANEKNKQITDSTIKQTNVINENQDKEKNISIPENGINTEVNEKKKKKKKKNKSHKNKVQNTNNVNSNNNSANTENSEIIIKSNERIQSKQEENAENQKEIINFEEEMKDSNESRQTYDSSEEKQYAANIENNTDENMQHLKNKEIHNVMEAPNEEANNVEKAINNSDNVNLIENDELQKAETFKTCKQYTFEMAKSHEDMESVLKELKLISRLNLSFYFNKDLQKNKSKTNGFFSGNEINKDSHDTFETSSNNNDENVTSNIFQNLQKRKKGSPIFCLNKNTDNSSQEKIGIQYSIDDINRMKIEKMKKRQLSMFNDFKRKSKSVADELLFQYVTNNDNCNNDNSPSNENINAQNDSSSHDISKDKNNNSEENQLKNNEFINDNQMRNTSEQKPNEKPTTNIKRKMSKTDFDAMYIYANKQYYSQCAANNANIKSCYKKISKYLPKDVVDVCSAASNVSYAKTNEMLTECASCNRFFQYLDALKMKYKRFSNFYENSIHKYLRPCKCAEAMIASIREFPHHNNGLLHNSEEPNNKLNINHYKTDKFVSLSKHGCEEPIMKRVINKMDSLSCYKNTMNYFKENMEKNKKFVHNYCNALYLDCNNPDTSSNFSRLPSYKDFVKLPSNRLSSFSQVSPSIPVSQSDYINTQKSQGQTENNEEIKRGVYFVDSIQPCQSKPNIELPSMSQSCFNKKEKIDCLSDSFKNENVTNFNANNGNADNGKSNKASEHTGMSQHESVYSHINTNILAYLKSVLPLNTVLENEIIYDEAQKMFFDFNDNVYVHLEGNVYYNTHDKMYYTIEYVSDLSYNCAKRNIQKFYDFIVTEKYAPCKIIMNMCLYINTFMYNVLNIKKYESYYKGNDSAVEVIIK